MAADTYRTVRREGERQWHSDRAEVLKIPPSPGGIHIPAVMSINLGGPGACPPEMFLKFWFLKWHPLTFWQHFSSLMRYLKLKVCRLGQPAPLSPLAMPLGVGANCPRAQQGPIQYYIYCCVIITYSIYVIIMDASLKFECLEGAGSKIWGPDPILAPYMYILGHMHLALWLMPIYSADRINLWELIKN